MPKPSPDGLHVLHGIGGGNASIDNRAFSRGAAFGWIDANHVVFANGDDEWIVSTYELSTKTIARVNFQTNASKGPIVLRATPIVDRPFSRSFERSPYRSPYQLPTIDVTLGQRARPQWELSVSANHGYAGGGVFATWFGSPDPNLTGLWTNTGFRAPAAGLLNVGPDGSICFKPDYQSNGPTMIRERSGEIWKIYDGTPGYVSMHGQKRAVLTAPGLPTVNLPACKASPNARGIWKVESAFAGGRWWMCPFYDPHGIALHPFDAFDGFAHLPHGDGWHQIAAIDANVIRIYTATGEGEQAGQIWVRDYDVVQNRVRDPWGANTWAPIARVDISRINVQPEEPVMTFRNFGDYLIRRWNELGVPEKTAEVTRKNSVTKTERAALKNLSDVRKSGRKMATKPPKRLLDLEEAYKAVQCPAFVRIVGELFHEHGKKDVGLNTKDSGNNWTLEDGRKVATDIVAIKPTDASGKVVAGNFHLIDAISSSNSADARPGWNDIGENGNSARPWVEPPVPSGDVVDPPVGETHKYDGGGHDTGECDICHKSRFDPIHAIPESKIKHTYDGGEEDTGLCDICQKDADDPIHGPGDPPIDPPIDPTKPHQFQGTGTFCPICGKAKSDPIHGAVVPPTGDLAVTNELLTRILDVETDQAKKLEQINTTLGKLGTQIVDAIKAGGLLDILRDRK